MILATQTTSQRPLAAERRQHQRFKAPEKTLAITPNIIGQIVDISAGGCELKYIDNNAKLPPNSAMDIMMNDKGFFMEQVPIAMAWHDSPPNPGLNTILIRKIGIRFADLSPIHKERIDYFIKNYAIGVA